VAEWKFVVADTDGNQLGELLAAKSRKVTWRRDAPADASWSMLGTDPGVADIQELLSDLLVYRGEDLVFRGRVGATSDDLDGTSHGLQVAAVDYRGLLDRRTVHGDLTFTADAKSSIAWDLIAHTQSQTNGDLGITNAAPLLPGLHDREYPDRKKIGEAIAELGRTENGFEWEIDQFLRFNLWAERGEARDDFVLEYGATVTAVSRAVDPAEYANEVRVSGADTTTPYDAEAADIATRPEGRFEMVVGDHDLSVQASVDELGEGTLAVAEVIQPSYQLTLIPDVWTPNDLWIGDTAPIRIRSGRLDVDTADRVEEISVTVGDDGSETVQLTFGRTRRDAAAKVVRAAVGGRLERLERR
jgi:hypothetical protein